MEKFDNDFFMRMSEHDFDQSPSGWRSLVALRKYVEAAELIREYLLKNSERVSDAELMCFHIGQLLASAGPEYYIEAIKEFKLSFQAGDAELWNAYVSATIGFLEGNIKKIDEAIIIIEKSSEEDKTGANLGIINYFRNALENGERNYEEVYSLATS